MSSCEVRCYFPFRGAGVSDVHLVRIKLDPGISVLSDIRTRRMLLDITSVQPAHTPFADLYRKLCAEPFKHSLPTDPPSPAPETTLAHEREGDREYCLANAPHSRLYQEQIGFPGKEVTGFFPNGVIVSTTPVFPLLTSSRDSCSTSLN